MGRRYRWWPITEGGAQVSGCKNPGAAGLDFETWESTNLNKEFAYLARIHSKGAEFGVL